MSVGIAGASARSNARVGDVEQLDRVLVKEGDRVVETVEDPTWDDVKRLNSRSADAQVVTTEDECVEYCCGQCYCSSCMCGCQNCCNVEEEICDCCDCTVDGCEDHDNCT